MTDRPPNRPTDSHQMSLIVAQKLGVQGERQRRGEHRPRDPAQGLRN